MVPCPKGPLTRTVPRRLSVIIQLVTRGDFFGQGKLFHIETAGAWAGFGSIEKHM
jgi:hypothetical protein